MALDYKFNISNIKTIKMVKKAINLLKKSQLQFNLTVQILLMKIQVVQTFEPSTITVNNKRI